MNDQLFDFLIRQLTDLDYNYTIENSTEHFDSKVIITKYGKYHFNSFLTLSVLYKYIHLTALRIVNKLMSAYQRISDRHFQTTI